MAPLVFTGTGLPGSLLQFPRASEHQDRTSDLCVSDPFDGSLSETQELQIQPTDSLCPAVAFAHGYGQLSLLTLLTQNCVAESRCSPAGQTHSWCNRLPPFRVSRKGRVHFPLKVLIPLPDWTKPCHEPRMALESLPRPPSRRVQPAAFLHLTLWLEVGAAG